MIENKASDETAGKTAQAVDKMVFSKSGEKIWRHNKNIEFYLVPKKDNNLHSEQGPGVPQCSSRPKVINFQKDLGWNRDKSIWKIRLTQTVVIILYLTFTGNKKKKEKQTKKHGNLLNGRHNPPQ